MNHHMAHAGHGERGCGNDGPSLLHMIGRRGSTRRSSSSTKRHTRRPAARLRGRELWSVASTRRCGGRSSHVTISPTSSFGRLRSASSCFHASGGAGEPADLGGPVDVRTPRRRHPRPTDGLAASALRDCAAPDQIGPPRGHRDTRLRRLVPTQALMRECNKIRAETGIVNVA